MGSEDLATKVNQDMTLKWSYWLSFAAAGAVIAILKQWGLLVSVKVLIACLALFATGLALAHLVRQQRRTLFWILAPWIATPLALLLATWLLGRAMEDWHAARGAVQESQDGSTKGTPTPVHDAVAFSLTRADPTICHFIPMTVSGRLPADRWLWITVNTTTDGARKYLGAGRSPADGDRWPVRAYIGGAYDRDDQKAEYEVAVWSSDWQSGTDLSRLSEKQQRLNPGKGVVLPPSYAARLGILLARTTVRRKSPDAKNEDARRNLQTARPEERPRVLGSLERECRQGAKPRCLLLAEIYSEGRFAAKDQTRESAMLDAACGTE